MSNTTISDAVEAIATRFRSGNLVPVERANVTREEWDALISALHPQPACLTCSGHGLIGRSGEDGELCPDCNQPEELAFTVEEMLTACVPGGSIVDPQVVADNIRAWVAKRKPAELAEQQSLELPPMPDPWYRPHSINAPFDEPLFTAEQMREYALAALAATGKQQVGEESAGLPEMCRSSTNAQGIQAGEVQGDSILRAAVAPPRRFDRVAAEAELSALAARQPGAQEPYGWLISGHAGGPMFCPASHRHVMEANATDLSKEIGITIVEVYAAPPAQGIDLGHDKFRDPDHLAEWLGSLVDGNEQEEWDAAQAAMQGVRAYQGDADTILRLQAVVEGECDGLAITPEQAVAILDYVLQPLNYDDGQRDAAPGVSRG